MLHGDRRPPPGPGRWRSKLRTPASGHRILLHREAAGHPDEARALPSLGRSPIPREEVEGGEGEGAREGEGDGDGDGAVDAECSTAGNGAVVYGAGGKRRKRKKRRKGRLPRATPRPSRQLRRRPPFPCTCLPTSRTTSSAVSRVRRRVGLLLPVFLPAVGGPVASTAQRHSELDIAFLLVFWVKVAPLIWTCLSTRAEVSFDATVPEVALDMSRYWAENCGDSAVAVYQHRRRLPVVAQRLFSHGPDCSTDHVSTVAPGQVLCQSCEFPPVPSWRRQLDSLRNSLRSQTESLGTAWGGSLSR